MTVSKREVITVTSAADPRSIINALREVPVDATVVLASGRGERHWYESPIGESISLTFERPVQS